MVSLDAGPRLRSARPGSGRETPRPRWLLAAGAGAAALGAAVGTALLSAITVLLWAAGPIVSDGVSAAPFRGAATLWLMGQRAPIESGTYELVLPPLLITAVVVVLTVRLAGWAARATAAHELAPAAMVGGGVLLGHATAAGVAAWVSARAGAGVDLSDALRAALILGVPCVIAGVVPQTWPWAIAVARVGDRVRTAARAAGFGALALAAGGAAALVLSLIVHAGEFSDVLGLVGGGVNGGVGVVLLCLALLPNAVLWVISLAAGPGFALGADGGLSLTGEMHGDALPALPLLAALPGAGPLPGYAWLLVAVPVGAGGVVGWFARPAGGRRRGWREELATAAVAGVVLGLGAGVLAGFSAGGAGGRLDEFGPNGLLVGVLLAAQLAAAAVVLAAGRIGWEHYRQPIERVAGRTMMPMPRIPTQKQPAQKQPAHKQPAQKKPGAEPKPAAEPKPTVERTADGSAGTPIEVVAAADVDDLADDDGAGPQSDAVEANPEDQPRGD
ncbi:DUF6350 family protein [Sporichthya polymorpha]|uniref:cell division protein PerM n=1 Tax=Sporichthya polymorpha TaxID=35751 RepID=UPI00036BD547|nr:DUF6350 family protein [Sporichthya polymorpha]